MNKLWKRQLVETKRFNKSIAFLDWRVGKRTQNRLNACFGQAPNSSGHQRFSFELDHASPWPWRSSFRLNHASPWPWRSSFQLDFGGIVHLVYIGSIMAPAHCTEAGKVFADKKSLKKTTFRGGQFAKVTFWGGTFEQVRERRERLAWLHKQFDHLNFIWPYEDDQGVWLDTSRDWQWNSYGCTSLAPGPSQDKVLLAVESCANQSSQC